MVLWSLTAVRSTTSGSSTSSFQTELEASVLGVKAGTDLTCGDEYKTLIEAVKKGSISEAEIDISVKRLLTARFRLGQFDPPEMVAIRAHPVFAERH